MLGREFSRSRPPPLLICSLARPQLRDKSPTSGKLGLFDHDYHSVENGWEAQLGRGTGEGGGDGG